MMSQNYATRRNLPSLMALRAFEAGARLGSFTLAAKELLLTQSAVSRHVRNLELYLDVPLFLRNGRQLVLTPQGHDYLVTLSDAFDRIAAATSSLRQRRSDDVLTVSMLPSVAVKWFTPLLTKFFEAYPTVDLR